MRPINKAALRGLTKGDMDPIVRERERLNALEAGKYETSECTPAPRSNALTVAYRIWNLRDDGACVPLNLNKQTMPPFVEAKLRKVLDTGTDKRKTFVIRDKASGITYQVARVSQKAYPYMRNRKNFCTPSCE